MKKFRIDSGRVEVGNAAGNRFVLDVAGQVGVITVQKKGNNQEKKRAFRLVELKRFLLSKSVVFYVSRYPTFQMSTLG